MNSFVKSRLIQAAASRGRLARAIAAVACAGAFSAACDVHGLSAPGSLASLEISPNPQTLAINATQQFTVVGKDFAGVIVPVSPVWSIAASGGAISTSGMFTAGTKTGTFANTVTATSGGKSATATVLVTAGPLASITLTPTPDTLNMGAQLQFTAVGKDAAGNVVSFTPTWSIIAGGGTISATGMYTAGNVAGTFTNSVQVSNSNIRATGTVTVMPGPLATLVVTPNPMTLNIGATQQYSVVGKDSAGNAVAFTPAWSVVAGGGSITAAGGLFTAGSTPGTFANTIKATVGAISGTATVTVVAGPVATITVTPNPQTLAAGATQQFTAVATDASGNILAITPAWSIAAGGGTIDFATGVFTAGNTAGTYTNTVRASSGGISGFATVTVTGGLPTTLTVTPNPVTLQTGGTQQFSATARDAGGTPVTVVAVWTVVNGGGTINSAGLFTAGNTAGTFGNTVQAVAAGLTAGATVIVTPVLAVIRVAPAAAFILPNATQQFSATGFDVNGNTFAISPVWSVSGGGSINALTGLFTSDGTIGLFTVTATSGAKTGTGTVTVSAAAPVLASITLTPNPANINTGAQQQFVAVGRDQNGNVFPIPAGAMWAASVASGTITQTGLFTAGATAGTYNNAVSLTSGLIVGNATVIEGAAVVPPFVNLGRAALNGIMAGTAVTCAGPAAIDGNISVWPGNAFTGPCVNAGLHSLGDENARLDQVDLLAAYNFLKGRACGTTITADLGGTTKLPGVYCAGTDMGITGDLTLDGNGDPNAVFLFQMGAGLTTAGRVLLQNGAQAKNVYWQVGSSATLGTASVIQGNILAFTSITLVSDAALDRGRALAMNGAVTVGAGGRIVLPLP